MVSNEAFQVTHDKLTETRRALAGLRELVFNSRAVIAEDQNDIALVDRLIAVADKALK